MRIRPPTLSPLQVIFRAFPDSVRYVGGHMTRVRDVSNPDGDRRDPLGVRIRQALARRMTYELARREAHEALRQQRFAARRAQPPAQPENAEALEPDTILPELFDEETTGSPQRGTARATPVATPMLHARDISLIEVTDDSFVRTRVFPRSVQCHRCGHFLLLNPERPPATFLCPCCKDGQLVIEPIVFICGRCAAVRELLPPAERVGGRRFRRRRRHDDSIGVPPRCPECESGHIHLEKHGTNAVSRWEWVCTNCNNYSENVQEPCGGCGVAGTVNDRAHFVFMQAIPAAATNALEPLVHQQMFVGDEEIELNALRAQAETQSSGWPDAFALASATSSGAVPVEDSARLRESCLDNAYLVNRVRVFTTTYGYKAGSPARHPQTPVDADDRLARFFPDPEGLARFLAYCVSTEGAALVLEFSPAQVMARLAAIAPALHGQTLAAAFAADATHIANHEVRDLLRVNGVALIVYRALHAVEHVLLNSAMQQIGSEALGSRLFPGAATIVIFEKAEIGRGGVVQLVNRGPGLVALFDAARDHALGCAQGCHDGCPACAYVRDPYCNQPLEDLGRQWLPPNSLLSRHGAAQVLGTYLTS